MVATATVAPRVVVVISFLLSTAFFFLALQCYYEYSSFYFSVLMRTVDEEAVVGVYDVIVIGAGWSGMAAADYLSRKSNVSFVVLESTNRTGGRSQAVEFGNPLVWRCVVEIGSNWISGVAPPGIEKGGAAGVAENVTSMPYENPLLELARKAQLKLHRVPGGADTNASDYGAVYASDGSHDGDPGGNIRARANEALDCLNASWAWHADPSLSVRQGLKDVCGWRPRSEEEMAVDWAICSGEDADGEPAEKLSLLSFFPDPTYKWWGPDDLFVVDQHPRGFARMVDEMVKDSIPPNDPRLIFNTEVTRIQYGGHHNKRSNNRKGNDAAVTIETKDGRVFRTEVVISTLPLGVLQRKHQDLFDPPLPNDQAELLSPSPSRSPNNGSSGYVMGNLTHVVVQFPRVWWDNNLSKWISANRGSNKTSSGGEKNNNNVAGEFCVWHNLNHRNLIPGSQSLLTFLGDPQSSKYEGMKDDDVKEAVVARLRMQHPDRANDIPDPSAFLMSRHGYDPNSYGAYSVSLVPWDGEHYHPILTRPVRDENGQTRVRLAGEAMCRNLNGYTHGAYQSGREQAAQYLYGRGLGPDPSQNAVLSLCAGV